MNNVIKQFFGVLSKKIFKNSNMKCISSPLANKTCGRVEICDDIISVTSFARRCTIHVLSNGFLCTYQCKAGEGGGGGGLGVGI